MYRAKAKILSIDSQRNEVVVREEFLEQNRNLFLDATPRLLPSPQKSLQRPSKPFFYRWINDWKLRNQGVTQ